MIPQVSVQQEVLTLVVAKAPASPRAAPHKMTGAVTGRGGASKVLETYRCLMVTATHSRPIRSPAPLSCLLNFRSDALEFGQAYY